MSWKFSTIYNEKKKRRKYWCIRSSHSLIKQSVTLFTRAILRQMQWNTIWRHMPFRFICSTTIFLSSSFFVFYSSATKSRLLPIPKEHKLSQCVLMGRQISWRRGWWVVRTVAGGISLLSWRGKEPGRGQEQDFWGENGSSEWEDCIFGGQ